MVHIAAREIMRFERVARDVDAGFHGGDAVIHNQADGNFAQAHPDHFANANGRVGDARAQPKAKGQRN